MRPRNPFWLFAGIVGLSLLGWFTHTFAPNSLLLLLFFFVIVGCITFALAYFIINNVRRAFLVALFCSGTLLLRFLNLRSPMYFLLLLASLVSLELYLRKR